MGRANSGACPQTHPSNSQWWDRCTYRDPRIASISGAQTQTRLSRGPEILPARFPALWWVAAVWGTLGLLPGPSGILKTFDAALNGSYRRTKSLNQPPSASRIALKVAERQRAGEEGPSTLTSAVHAGLTCALSQSSEFLCEGLNTDKSVESGH